MTRMVSSTRLNGSHTLAASALLIGLSLLGFIPPTWAGQPYEEAGGQVVIEAEHAGVITSPMQVASDLAASGGSYILVPNGTTAGGNAVYDFTISTPGTYVLWGRVLAPTGIDDSFHVAFDGDPNQDWHVARNTSWIWDQANNTSAVDPATFDLGIGTHTLTITRREDGTQIDKIILTNNLTYVPDLTGPAESPQTSVDPPPSTSLITNVTASTGAAHERSVLNVGEMVYTDRTYAFTIVPPAYVDQDFIRTANNDKVQTGASYLTFTLSANATVYVAYDSRATALPAWLDDGTWTNTGDTVDSTDVPLHLHSKVVAAGSVTLGGNRMAPSAGAGTNYIVIAVPSSTPPPPGDTTPLVITITTPKDNTIFIAQ